MKRSTGHVSILIRNSDCLVCKSLEDQVLRAVFRGVRCGESTSTHVIQLSAPPYRGSVRRISSQEGQRIYRRSGGLLFIEARSCTACKVLSTSACIPRQAIYVPGMGIIFSVLIPNSYVLREIFHKLRSMGKIPELLGDSTPLPKGLTRKQGLVLLTAIRLGYLNTPRECGLRQVAGALNLSKSTVSRQLKAALRKLALDALLEYEYSFADGNR